MTCAREDDWIEKAHKKMQLKRLPHARKCLRVLFVRGAVCCLHPPAACKGIAISCKRNYL